MLHNPRNSRTTLPDHPKNPNDSDALTGPRPGAAVRYVLLVLGNQEGDYASFPLPEDGTVSIGRSRENDIRIDDPSMSRKHALLHVGLAIQVEDLGSANGTRVRDARLVYNSSPDLRETSEWNDRKVEPGRPTEVSPGDVIEFGGAVVMVQPMLSEQRPRRLWSHGYFEGRLEEECARAERAKGHFAVVRVHATDAAQAAIEEGLGAATRAEDVVATYGPGEYEVLAADADEVIAGQIWKRVEDELAARGVQSRSGIACYPRDGRNPEALLAKACARALGTDDAEPQVGPLVVMAPAMQRLFGIAERIAGGTICVLLLGETGVGKEVLADRIHHLSPRATKPFLRLNCAAFPENLLESELFGYERGAFTGAMHAKIGLLESATGGTVFLDEVGELPMATQSKLLRVLEAREVMRLGAVKTRPIDVRFIAATNRDLENEARAGRFREDLYFRISGVSLVIPPLRERMTEIEPMTRAFLSQLSREAGRSVPHITGEAFEWLQRYSWPGNVRELRNTIERALLLCGDSPITLEHLPIEKTGATLPYRPARLPPPPAPPRPWPPIARDGGSDRPPAMTVPPPPPTGYPMEDESEDNPDALRARMTEAEKQRIMRALEACAGNQTRAAKVLGISRRTLVSRLAAFNLPRPRRN
jgi:two-component system, NtrC family, response regulator AtoC